jgi:hypothetical protein
MEINESVVKEDIHILNIKVVKKSGLESSATMRLYVTPTANCQVFSIYGIEQLLKLAEYKEDRTELELSSIREIVRVALNKAFVRVGKRIALVDINSSQIQYFLGIPHTEVTYTMPYVSTQNSSSRAMLFIKNLNHGK